MFTLFLDTSNLKGLNESPSQKEGKCLNATPPPLTYPASMKALPKRKGNNFCA